MFLNGAACASVTFGGVPCQLHGQRRRGCCWRWFAAVFVRRASWTLWLLVKAVSPSTAGRRATDGTASRRRRCGVWCGRCGAVPGGSGQVRLTWLAPASNGGAAVTDYVIQRSWNGTGGWVAVSDGVRATTGYTVSNLSNGTRYWFRVSARNAAGTGPVSVAVNAVPRTVPGVVRSLGAVPGGSGQVRLTWLAPASNGGAVVTDYVIQRSWNGTGGWVVVSDGVRATTGYTVSNLSNGTRYWFRVSARNAAGTGPVSVAVNAVAPR